MAEKKIGLTLGKFAPLHKGHQSMIETAIQEMDEVVIIIYDADETRIPLSVRARWLKTIYPEATVIEAWDGPQQMGNTPEIRAMHEKYIIGKLQGKKITHFYSNDFYGEHVSKALGAENRQIDRNRTIIPVSGTIIRNDTFKYREFIHPVVYADIIAKIVFIGAPSTGKSTITEKMAKEFGTVFMPEYGREYWEKHQVSRRLEPEQMLEIAEEHIKREDKLVLDANKYLFVDTNAVTTYMFACDYHGYAVPALEQLAVRASSRYDLVFLCGDDIPYDNTWDRSGEANRAIFQKKIIADLKERRQPFITLNGDLHQRIAKVTIILSKFEKFGELPLY